MAFFDDIIVEINKETAETKQSDPAMQPGAASQQSADKEQAATPAALPFKYDDVIMQKYK
jgi:hypothetical protein